MAVAGKLLCLRQDLKGAAMFLFARVEGFNGEQGKNREPGLQEKFVKNFYWKANPVLPTI